MIVHAGHAGDVGDDMMQLQVHLHQRLLHVLNMRRRIIQQPLPLPEVGAQPGDFGLGPEARPQQAVFVQTLQPFRVTDVSFAPRHVLRVPRVDHHHLEPALLQDFEDRDPVDPGRIP